MSPPTPSTSPTPASSAGVKRPSRLGLTGWIVSGVVALFNVIDDITKMAQIRATVDGAHTLGFPTHFLFGIGLTLVICSLLFMVPFTSFVGAVLLTGYLGGAVAIQVRVESMNALFALALGVLVWVGLLLRDARLRALLRESLIG